jgi:hypothetical protein
LESWKSKWAVAERQLRRKAFKPGNSYLEKFGSDNARAEKRRGKEYESDDNNTGLGSERCFKDEHYDSGKEEPD